MKRIVCMTIRIRKPDMWPFPPTYPHFRFLLWRPTIYTGKTMSIRTYWKTIIHHGPNCRKITRLFLRSYLMAIMFWKSVTRMMCSIRMPRSIFCIYGCCLPGTAVLGPWLPMVWYWRPYVWVSCIGCAAGLWKNRPKSPGKSEKSKKKNYMKRSWISLPTSRMSFVRLWLWLMA